MEEGSEPFHCPICLELVYRPVVTYCGHFFCFWCVHRSMNNKAQSHCPVCRRSFRHFPRVCQLLHAFLKKVWPNEYRSRAQQTQELEHAMKLHIPHSLDSPELQLIEDSKFLPCLQQPLHLKQDSVQYVLQQKERMMFCQQSDARSRREVTLEDFSCASCSKCVYRPVILNCGEVFCESCLITADSASTFHCPSCGRPHTAGSTYVCLKLHDFLKRTFREEYSKRKEELYIYVEKEHNLDLERRIRPENKESSQGSEGEEAQFTNVGVGCDECGMYPIMGDRYNCVDCGERRGYDLCGDCYQCVMKGTTGVMNRGKLRRGRFDQQQHTDKHRMEKAVMTQQRKQQQQQQQELMLLLVMSDFDNYVDHLV